jgi:hypothetical protein
VTGGFACFKLWLGPRLLFRIVPAIHLPRVRHILAARFDYKQGTNWLALLASVAFGQYPFERTNERAKSGLIRLE